MSAKRKLAFKDADAIAAEVRHLRRGYRKTGNWSLPQICWHLNAVMTFTMSPGPHATPTVSPEARVTLAKILAGGDLPSINAPERVLPPETASEADIDTFLATVERFKAFRGPFAPHRLFGEIVFDDYVRLHLIHSGHHLGYLIPETTN